MATMKTLDYQDFKMATGKQLFALYLGTGSTLELRKLGDKLSINDASILISRMKNGENPSIIRDELIKFGAEVKSNETSTPDKKDWQAIYNEAHAAGLAAAKNHIPTPMVVNKHSDPLNDNSPVVKSYFVDGGVCGFAWVAFKGNTSWGKWALKNKIASKKYSGGLQIWIHDFSQSMELKYKYAVAFAKVLEQNGIDAYAASRMD